MGGQRGAEPHDFLKQFLLKGNGQGCLILFLTIPTAYDYNYLKNISAVQHFLPFVPGPWTKGRNQFGRNGRGVQVKAMHLRMSLF